MRLDRRVFLVGASASAIALYPEPSFALDTARIRSALDYAQLVEHVATIFDLRPARSPMPEPHSGLRERSHYDAPASQPKADDRTNAHEVPLFQGPTHEPCPTCKQPLQQTVVAGYRVRYCNHCHYKRQELVQGVRR